METDKPRENKCGFIVKTCYSCYTIKMEFWSANKSDVLILLSFLTILLHWQFVVKKEQITHIIWILAFVFSSVYLF